MNNTKPKILVIVGATASGKTSLSITLAKKFSGEIISADSRQVYKNLNIGTGKITTKEMQDVPHHLLDVASPINVYTVDDFQIDASNAIAEIVSRGHLPIIAGGTFFYIDILLGRVTHPKVPRNSILREHLETMSTNELFQKLKTHDPARAKTIDSKNPRRLIRALEIIDTLGKVPQIPVKENYSVLTIGIKCEKEELRLRFHNRAKQWLDEGFMTEIEILLKQGITIQRLNEIGFEYILGLQLYNKEINEEAFLQKFVEKNWQYAKRQNLWLKKDSSIVWINNNDTQSAYSTILHWLRD